MVARIDTAHLESLITFLSVARLGRYTATAKSLGINHSTVSRRIADLEKALGGAVLTRGAHGWELTELGTRVIPAAETAERALRDLESCAEGRSTRRLGGMIRIAAPDAFTTYVAIPALAELQIREPGLGIEITTATQQVRQRRSGVDIEIVLGKPIVNKAVTHEILSYELKLYASADYLERAGTPTSISELAQHRLNYYIESALQVDDLDLGARKIPSYQLGISSTSVFAHVASTLSGAGIGLLPEYAAKDPALIPVLGDRFAHRLSYWSVVREENIRNPAVLACLSAINAFAHSAEFRRRGRG
ncbi:LysR family transcriptional regulator [Corynebacterium pacaense]|uniref:LysR family transcriptional regulator n=1 Tax=Corynebacterium pacaense TaxID=1816684 RepID=UPI0015C456BC|nr:LysR family transcriptional regulator [Corynebacterium pacaense]